MTLHLDQDNSEDQERYLLAINKKSHVLNLNYAEVFSTALKSNPDSMIQTPVYAEMNASRQLLTSDINEVKEMINSYLIAKEYSKSRIHELSNVVRDQGRLIRLLKREFDLE